MIDQLDPVRNDVAHMRDAVLFDGPTRARRLNRFWILLVLAALIASAGVIGDSTATVIGAMIVAPMMLPIQGTMLSTVLGDRHNLFRSILTMIAGSVVAIMIGFLVGLLDPQQVVAATNSQVAGRVSPGLIDLLAALSTGVVGSIALIRRDISDTLPGVAIAISLVPPLCVVGLTLESGAYLESLGALLLYVTNVAAILATGVVVMTLYKVQQMPEVASSASVIHRKRAVAVIAIMLAVISIPLAYSTVTFSKDSIQASTVESIASGWAEEVDWKLLQVSTSGGASTIRVTGGMPLPDTAILTEALRSADIDPSQVEVEMIPSYTVDLGGR